MPYKNIEQRRLYNKNLKQQTRNKNKWKQMLKPVMYELTTKSILPIHIYNFRAILKDMLKSHFNKRVIRVFNKTELITLSYDLFRHHTQIS